MSYTILPYSTNTNLDGQDALNMQAQILAQTTNLNVPQKSKLYLGSKITIESDGNLNLSAGTTIVSEILDARFQAQTDATIMQKGRIDTILSGSA